MPRSLLLAATLTLTACGARPTTRTEKPPEVVEMEPMVVEYSTDEEGQGHLRAFDAQELFEDGKAAFDRQDFAAADSLFGELIERFPESRFTHAALYNRGLALEYLRQHQLAGVHFRRYAQLATELRDQRDGEFRWGYNLIKTGDLPTAIDLYNRLLEATDLGPLDRAECHLRRGTAFARLGRPAEAERDLKRAMALVEEGTEGYVGGNDLLAEAHFRRGELYQRLSHKVPLKLPLPRMKDDLAEKVRFFRQAQASFIDALNVQHSYWATAAGLKLGELYEQFYRDVLQAEVPTEFTEATRRFYTIELRKQLQPLLEQSLTIYEKNITMSERLGAANEWVSETDRRLTRLRSLIESNERGVDVEALPPLESPEIVEPPPPPPPPAAPIEAPVEGPQTG
ncbi:MAG: tetratricopeptide repeat protein [Myxococcales bacterium]|nr:tetratricopeptide repeat protein [Myxococcales bacterium]